MPLKETLGDFTLCQLNKLVHKRTIHYWPPDSAQMHKLDMRPINKFNTPPNKYWPSFATSELIETPSNFCSLDWSSDCKIASLKIYFENFAMRQIINRCIFLT